MLNFALLALILLAMIIPVAIIGALGLALKGSLDLSIVDFYIVIAPTHALAVLVIAEVAVVAAAAYLIGYTQIRWLTA